MNGRRTLWRNASLALVLLGCALAAACGGGGGDGGTTPPAVVATFTPIAIPGKVSMDNGTSTNSNLFDVNVMVNDIDDLFV